MNFEPWFKETVVYDKVMPVKFNSLASDICMPFSIQSFHRSEGCNSSTNRMANLIWMIVISSWSIEKSNLWSKSVKPIEHHHKIQLYYKGGKTTFRIGGVSFEKKNEPQKPQTVLTYQCIQNHLEFLLFSEDLLAWPFHSVGCVLACENTLVSLCVEFLHHKN